MRNKRMRTHNAKKASKTHIFSSQSFIGLKVSFAISPKMSWCLGLGDLLNENMYIV